MERNRKIWMQILVLAAVLRFFPFDFQTAVSTASEDVAAECAGGEEQKPKIALTFDDGPNIKYTPMLLDGLKERGIKATFFLIGASIDNTNTMHKIPIPIRFNVIFLCSLIFLFPPVFCNVYNFSVYNLQYPVCIFRLTSIMRDHDKRSFLLSYESLHQAHHILRRM